LCFALEDAMTPDPKKENQKPITVPGCHCEFCLGGFTGSVEEELTNQDFLDADDDSEL